MMVDNYEKLLAILPLIEKAEWVSLDTEADSFYSYPEKICLIQITVPGKDFIIDPLQKFNLAPLFDILKSKRLILHGADYDLRLLYKNYEFAPEKIFDTMHAARLLGYKQIGLADLVKKHIGIALDKSHQRSNWTIRPISPKMVEYAIRDTCFLRPLEVVLSKQLKEKGRIEWLEETCERLVLKVKMNSDSDNEPWRIRGSSILSPCGLSVLRELWRWREQTAIAQNKPPFFILRHDALIEIAIRAANGFDITPFIPGHLLDSRLGEIKEAIQRGLNIPVEEQPQQIRNEKPRLLPEQTARLNKILRLRNRLAERLKIERSVIASQSEVIELARTPENGKKILMNWQYDLLKEAIEGRD